MKKTTIIFGILYCSIYLCICSCKKFIQVDPPETQAELGKIFADDQTATSAVVGLYVQMMAGNGTFFNGGYTSYNALYADELSNTSVNATNDFFKNNTLLATNGTVLATMWSGAYKNIYHANTVLEGLAASPTLTSSVKNQLQGEMLYIRSLQYFYMLNIFGDIPLQLTSNYETNSVMPRTPTDLVYKQIIADLLLAKELLNNGFATSVNTRPNKAAVTALLAKVYLYRGDWAQAEIQCTEVIGMNKYSLEPLNNVFMSTSKEVLFQLSKANGNTSEGLNFVPTSSTVRPAYVVTSYLFDAFDPGDNRKTSWLKSNTVSGVTYFYPNKYKIRTSTPVTEFYVVQRLAELHLIRAEARAQLDKLSAAISDVDVIRTRAGLTNALIADTKPGISKADLLNAILKERQTELFIEWGNRFLDLKRSGRADEILGIRKAPNWQPSDKLYPIPYAQIQVNPALRQNDGYSN